MVLKIFSAVYIPAPDALDRGSGAIAYSCQGTLAPNPITRQSSGPRPQPLECVLVRKVREAQLNVEDSSPRVTGTEIGCFVDASASHGRRAGLYLAPNPR